MDEFCKSLHPFLADRPVCINWLRHAGDRCIHLMKTPQQFNVWGAIKNMVYPDTSFSVLGRNIPISFQPNNLNVEDCRALFINVFREYILIAPRYAIELEINSLICQMLTSLIGVSAMAFITVTTIKAFNKYKNKNSMSNNDTSINKSGRTEPALLNAEECMRAIINRSMRIAQYEVTCLKIQCIIQEEKLMPLNGIRLLIMHVKSKLQLQDENVVYTGHNVRDSYRHNKKNGIHNQVDFEPKQLTKTLDFLNTFPSELRLFVVMAKWGR